MAAGRGLAAGIGMSLRARERSRRSARHPDRYGRGRGRSPARRAHSEIHNRVAPGARRRPGRRPRHFSPARVLGGRHRGADRKRFDRGALIRPIVMRTADRAPSASAGGGLSTRTRCKTSMPRQPPSQSSACSVDAIAGRSTRKKKPCGSRAARGPMVRAGSAVGASSAPLAGCTGPREASLSLASGLWDFVPLPRAGS